MIAVSLLFFFFCLLVLISFRFVVFCFFFRFVCFVLFCFVLFFGFCPYLILPQVTDSQNLLFSSPKKVFGNAHAYHINSVSLNCDGETFLSADDLRVNIWNLDNSVQSFSTSPPSLPFPSFPPSIIPSFSSPFLPFLIFWISLYSLRYCGYQAS